MSLRDIINRTQKLAVDNSPAILTALGVTGALTTAYLTGKASFKAAEVLAIDARDREIFETNNPGELQPRSNRDVAELIWKLYIPAVASGVLTCAAIISANQIGTRRTAAMAAAFSLSEKAYDEYKDKVVEQIGKNKEQKVRDEIAQDKVTAKPPVDGQVIITDRGGDVLFMDALSGRYFQSTMEDVLKAQNDTNYIVINHGYASLTELYSKLGLSSTKMSDDLGWSSEKLLEMTFSTTMTSDDRPCIVMDFRVAPTKDYFRVH